MKIQSKEDINRERLFHLCKHLVKACENISNYELGTLNAELANVIVAIRVYIERAERAK